MGVGKVILLLSKRRAHVFAQLYTCKTHLQMVETPEFTAVHHCLPFLPLAGGNVVLSIELNRVLQASDFYGKNQCAAAIWEPYI